MAAPQQRLQVRCTSGLPIELWSHALGNSMSTSFALALLNTVYARRCCIVSQHVPRSMQSGTL